MLDALNKPACIFPFPEADSNCCRCHERLGNDYWFLPFESCLYADAKPAHSMMPPVDVRTLCPPPHPHCPLTRSEVMMLVAVTIIFSIALLIPWGALK